jgi:serine/threonine protein kinase
MLNNQIYIVMEKGEQDLKKYIRNLRVRWCETPQNVYAINHKNAIKWKLLERLRILVGIVEGLRYMHARNVIHLDLKPHNIILMANK